MVKVPKGVTLVVGLGVSGRAICRHLSRLGRPFMVVDTRAVPPGMDDFHAAHPGVEVHCGPPSDLDLSEVEEVVVSPGVDPRAPGLAELADRSREATGEPLLVGEIALFVRACRAPIVAITGSNAKSTVTTLIGEMAREAGRRVAVGGNLGTPALDLLAEAPEAEVYVLELSSRSRRASAPRARSSSTSPRTTWIATATWPATGPPSIFRGARHGVINAEDPMTWPETRLPAQDRFTTGAPAAGEWGTP